MKELGSSMQACTPGGWLRGIIDLFLFRWEGHSMIMMMVMVMMVRQ